MENQKLRVYWREVDENGNEIKRGVDDREYVNYGSAENRARKLFGSCFVRKGESGIEWRVTIRDPWAKYFGECECKVCGQVFMSEEYPHTPGYFRDADSVHLYTRSDVMKELTDGERCPEYNGWCCPDCAMKIHKFITGLRKG